MRGNVTASRRIMRGGGMRRADARQRQQDETQRNNQLAQWWEVVAQQVATWGRGGPTRSDVPTSWKKREANGRQQSEATHWEAAVQWEWQDKRWCYNQPGKMRGRWEGKCDAIATATAVTTTVQWGHWSHCNNKASMTRDTTPTQWGRQSQCRDNGKKASAWQQWRPSNDGNANALDERVNRYHVWYVTCKFWLVWLMRKSVALDKKAWTCKKIGSNARAAQNKNIVDSVIHE